MNRMVKEILISFADSLKDLVGIGVITPEHLETTNRNKLNETHSLIWSVLCRSIYQTVGKHVVAVEHGLKPEGKGMRKFTPDISLWKVDGGVKKLVGILDYESTNSSDSRIIRRDFENYRHYIQNPLIFNIPEFWVIITTLPSKKVRKSDWYSWDLRRKRIYRDEYLKMLENPFHYWFPKYTAKFNELEEQRKNCPLYVVNLNATELRLCLPNDEAFSHRTSRMKA